MVYDRAGDAHYDTISAFIKSMRASDEKGAIYWLAKMLHAGEDFRFIARRIVIFASEDVGLADAGALAARDRDPAGGRVCRHAGSAHSTRPRHRLHVPREEESRSLRVVRAQRREEIEAEKTKRVPEKLKNKHFPVNPA